tara:strand:+ start:614 stop:772 length:159 start_codon:yes stop_codon:yes gene_type:complete
MKLLKKAIFGGLVLTTGTLVIGSTIFLVANKNKIVDRIKKLQFKENKSASIK